MIIFGTRSIGKLLATLYFVCRNCGNPAAQQLVRRGTWFTLFFIPLFPVHITRATTCTFCGVQTKVSKAEADQMIAANAGGPPASNTAPPAPQPARPQPGYPTQPPQGH